MPRKKSYNDLLAQAQRIRNLAIQLGAKRSNGTGSVNGIIQPFNDYSEGNIDAANRANRAITAAYLRTGRIEKSKQFARDQRNADEVYYRNGYSDKSVAAASKPYERKYGEYTQLGERGYNASRRAKANNVP